jgi:hypothetical protein
MNLKRTSLEPALPTQVVIDRESVANRPLGASAWSRVERREYDDLSGDDTNEESDRKQPADAERLQYSACSKGLASAKGRQKARQSGRRQEE